MANFVKASRTIVIKASRETIGLVAVASAMTFLLAYSVHTRPAPVAPPAAAAQREWTGHLAELQPAPAVPSQALTSADLVVPKAQLALPAIPAKPVVVKRACEDASCAKVPVPPPRRVAAVARTESGTGSVREPKRSMLSNLNPLNHLPPMSTVSKPFTYAGEVVSGWINRL